VNYSLHPDARRDLRDAAQYYDDHAGAARALALLDEFEHSVESLVQHPELGTPGSTGSDGY
jgi:plasmid stabilization system protein ParE